jgi:DNA-binding XRE family transcriptional regulator
MCPVDLYTRNTGNKQSDHYRVHPAARCIQASKIKLLSPPMLTATSVLLGRSASLDHPSSQISVSSRCMPKDIGCRFGVRLRDLRRAKNMTQMDMASTFGIDRSYISDLECGKKGVSLATLEVIALGFRVKLSDLLQDL